jgi:hypothetical protein
MRGHSADLYVTIKQGTGHCPRGSAEAYADEIVSLTVKRQSKIKSYNNEPKHS